MKSTFSKIVALYQITRLDHLKDPRKTLGIIPGKGLIFSFSHKSVDLVDKEFIAPLHDWMERSPYFQSMNHGNLTDLGIEFKRDKYSSAPPAYIGTDLIFYVP